MNNALCSWYVNVMTNLGLKSFFYDANVMVNGPIEIPFFSVRNVARIVHLLFDVPCFTAIFVVQLTSTHGMQKGLDVFVPSRRYVFRSPSTAVSLNDIFGFVLPHQNCVIWTIGSTFIVFIATRPLLRFVLNTNYMFANLINAKF